MGTLYDQPERKYYQISPAELEDYVATIVDVSKKSKVSIEAVIQVARVLELKRANDLRVANGDIFDEQIGGIGELLQQIALAIKPSPE